MKRVWLSHCRLDWVGYLMIAMRPLMQVSSIHWPVLFKCISVTDRFFFTITLLLDHLSVMTKSWLICILKKYLIDFTFVSMDCYCKLYIKNNIYIIQILLKDNIHRRQKKYIFYSELVDSKSDLFIWSDECWFGVLSTAVIGQWKAARFCFVES